MNRNLSEGTLSHLGFSHSPNVRNISNVYNTVKKPPSTEALVEIEN